MADTNGASRPDRMDRVERIVEVLASAAANLTKRLLE
jgi:hypothetical protein